MKDGKEKSKHWRAANIWLIFVGIALAAVLYQPWRVHAFSVTEAIKQRNSASASVSKKIETVEPTKRMKAGLVSKDQAWAQGDAISILSDFYQSIITYMGIMLGAVTVFAVVTVRFLSKAAAEDMAHDSAKKAIGHYLETKQFDEVVNIALMESGIASDLERYALDQESLTNELKKLSKDLRKLKKQVMDQKHNNVDASSGGAEENPMENEDEYVEGSVQVVQDDEAQDPPDMG